MTHLLATIHDAVTVALLVAATSDPAAGRPVNPDLSYNDRVRVVTAIVAESRRHGIDPVLVTAVAWSESDLRPGLVVARTDDYCYLQVHWQRLDVRAGETWLVGVDSPDALLDVDACARAGVAELAHWRARCRWSPWWQCYKWGYREPNSSRYADRIADRAKWLRARVRRVVRAWERGGDV